MATSDMSVATYSSQCGAIWDSTSPEPAPISSPFQKEAVLRGGQPHMALMIRQPAGRHGLALQPHGAPRRAGAFDARPDPGRLAALLDHGGDRPGPALRLARHPPTELGAGGVAKAASRGEQADRLEQVGLSRPIGSNQKHRPPVERQLGPLVGAEIRQSQMGEGRHAPVIAGFAPASEGLSSPSIWLGSQPGVVGAYR